MPGKDYSPGYAAGLGTPMSEEDAKSHAAKLQMVWIVTEQLRKVGKMLSGLGPLAPPCIALPYTAMREKVLDAAGAILEDIRARGTEEEWRAFERTLGTGPLFPEPKGEGGLIKAFRSLPEIKVFWDKAPLKWWGMTTPVPMPGPGKLGGLEPLVPPVPGSSIQRVVFTRAMAAQATQAAGSLWNSTFWRVAKYGGRIFGKAFVVLWVADMGWDAAKALNRWLGPPASFWSDSVRAFVAQGLADKAVEDFNKRFVPETVQQIRAAARAILSAHGNPAAMLPAMLAVTPANEKPVPTIDDAFDGDEMAIGDETKFKHDPWLILGVFTVGTAADLALGMER